MMTTRSQMCPFLQVDQDRMLSEEPVSVRDALHPKRLLIARCTDNNIDIFFKIADALALGHY
jgi:hypothetical protein